MRLSIKQIKINYETYFSINSMLKDGKNQLKRDLKSRLS
jgi:hypothetical protein